MEILTFIGIPLFESDYIFGLWVNVTERLCMQNFFSITKRKLIPKNVYSANVHTPIFRKFLFLFFLFSVTWHFHCPYKYIPNKRNQVNLMSWWLLKTTKSKNDENKSFVFLTEIYHNSTYARFIYINEKKVKKKE